ncbi:RBBP9/YdeN family alpha/beta hydrolase [Cellvibrio sp.]|uniref:RBBP9/YdeN family alpha/beta hydrolase n=1 Tax=Cellvibrio sp. TaxID=1965322 RepID=UPI00396488B6
MSGTDSRHFHWGGVRVLFDSPGNQLPLDTGINMQQPEFLFLAGYGNSTGDHWQAKWFNAFPSSIWVEQNWESPNRNEWVSALDIALGKTSNPVVIISHSLGGLAFVEWANQYPEQLQQKIRGAFLVAVPDADADSFPAAISGFSSTPAQKIAIPAIMVMSSDDPYCTLERSRYFAKAWGSELINIGAKGHINTSAGLGDWPEGEQHLHQFLKSLS